MKRMMAAAVLGLLCVSAKQEEGFQPVFNGKDFSGLKFFFSKTDHDPMKTFRVEDGIIKCSGRPYGYMVTEKKYKDFILKFDWKFVRPEGIKDEKKFRGNSGYLLFIQKIDGSVYKNWPRTLELQGRWWDVAKVFALGIKAKHTSDNEARERARKPLGEWNTYEIVSKDGIVTGTVNGIKITTVTDHDFNGKAGHIGFQSEGAEIHWKNIRIKVPD